MKKILNHPFFKGSAIMFGGTMIANVLAYVYHLLVGRILGPEGYGELAALLSIFYILNAPSAVVQNILVKFFSQLRAQREHGQAKRLFVRINRLFLIIVALCFVVLLPFVSSIAGFLHMQQSINVIWLYCMFGTFLFSIINVSALQANQQFMALTAVNAVGGILRTGLGAFGALFGVSWALFANAAAGILGYVSTFIPMKKFLRYRESVLTIALSDAWRYSIPACIAIIAITALYSQDVVLVKHYFSAQEAGVYSSLSVLGKIIFFASSSLGAVAFPMLAERKELGKPYRSIVFLSLGIVAFLSFSITTVYWLFPGLVVSLLFGSAFLGATSYLAPFGLFISFFTLSYLFVTMYIALGKTEVWFPAVIAALFQIALMVLYHNSLSTVIWNNTMIVFMFFVALLVYYPYADRAN